MIKSLNQKNSDNGASDEILWIKDINGMSRLISFSLK